MLYKLLSINGTNFIEPDKGSFAVAKNDKVNEYETEDGYTTIELVRSNIITGTMSYRGLMVDQIATLDALLSPVSTLTIFDPMTNNVKTITARISGRSTSKIIHENDISAWSYSFNIEEL